METLDAIANTPTISMEVADMAAWMTLQCPSCAWTFKRTLFDKIRKRCASCDEEPFWIVIEVVRGEIEEGMMDPARKARQDAAKAIVNLPCGVCDRRIGDHKFAEAEICESRHASSQGGG